MKRGDEVDTLISTFLIVTKFLNVSANQTELKKIAENSGTVEGEILLLKFAKHYKLKSKLTVIKEKQLNNIKSPVIGKKKDGSFFIIAKTTSDKVMILNSGSNQPELLDFSALSEIWDGTCVFISKRGFEAKEAIFSFKWFIPTVFKFKKEFIKILVAVFVIQILGILTPVMTQVA